MTCKQGGSMSANVALDINELVIPPSYSAGHYEVRMAETAIEIEQAQKLRYQVFYVEKQGEPSEAMRNIKKDFDEWDENGFHIIVVDKRSDDKVVGTLRLFCNLCLAPGQLFYTEQTFDMSGVKQHFQRSLELSRFCIDSNGRGGAILMLIWKYAMRFIHDNYIDVMIGCASFSGTNIDTHLPILSHLYQNHLAPESLRPKPKTDEFINLNKLANTVVEENQAQKLIPPLLRGYLKIGAKISDAAIIDRSFNTVYVAIYVESSGMKEQNPNLVNTL